MKRVAKRDYGRGLNKDTFGEELARIKQETVEYYDLEADLEEKIETYNSYDSYESEEEISLAAFNNQSKEINVLPRMKSETNDLKMKKPGLLKIIIRKFAVVLIVLFLIGLIGRVGGILEEFRYAQKETEVYSEKHEGTRNGTLNCPNQYASKIWIEGREIQIPCKLSEFMAIYRLSKDEQSILEEFESDALSSYVYMYRNDKFLSLMVNVKNLSGEEITDIGELDVVEVSDFNNKFEQARFYKGIKLGIKEDTLINKLQDIKYRKLNHGENAWYTFSLYNDSEIIYHISVENGIVYDITIRMADEQD